MCICYGHARACPLDPVTNVCIFIGCLGKMKLWTVKCFMRGFADRDAVNGCLVPLRQCNRKLCQGEIELAFRMIDFEVSHHSIRKQISFFFFSSQKGYKLVYLFWNLSSYDSLLYDLALENACHQSTWPFLLKVFTKKANANKWKMCMEININGCGTGDWGEGRGNKEWGKREHSREHWNS